MSYIKIELPYKLKHNIFALGAHSKAGFCFIKKGIAYVSNAGGDLSDAEDLKSFEKRSRALKRRLNIDPRIIACDLHPEYFSTKLAFELGEKNAGHVRQIQHHEAHIASSMAENKIKGDVIGVAFDGAGFGRDGAIWGGEFFVGGIGGFKRAGHLRYISMPGGEASVREPRHMALSYLYKVYGPGFRNLKIGFLNRLDENKTSLLLEIIDKGINSPLTSSAGRLFDAVSSIIGICDTAKYEGQAAIELEKAIVRDHTLQVVRNKYSFKCNAENGVVIADWTPVIKGVVKDLERKKDKREISLKFHNSVCDMIKDVCSILRKRYKLRRICLSGGVFQNRYLTAAIRPVLEKEGFTVYLHKDLPSHDGNIALGQAVMAGHRL